MITELIDCESFRLGSDPVGYCRYGSTSRNKRPPGLIQSSCYLKSDKQFFNSLRFALEKTKYKSLLMKCINDFIKNITMKKVK